MILRSLTAAVCFAMFCASAMAQEPGDDVFAKKAKYQTPSVEQVKGMVAAWLDAVAAEPEVRGKVNELWSAETEVGSAGPALLKRLAGGFGLAEPQARELVDICSQSRRGVDLPNVAWLAAEQTAPFVRNNLRLFYGRWLCQQRLYDESLLQLKDIQPETVVDPASLWFYQSVAHHRLLHKKEGLQAIAHLLDDVAGSPLRYVSVASLMHDDLAALKDASLDHISRQMDDVERRLDLGRTGKTVRKVEDDIIAALDKMIEEEEKKQQQQSSSSSGPGQKQSTQPAPDSKILGGRGPGYVDRRNIGSRSGWGELPEKERAKALQQVGKDFPAHYREVIQRYFRRLAAEGD